MTKLTLPSAISGNSQQYNGWKKIVRMKETLLIEKRQWRDLTVNQLPHVVQIRPLYSNIVTVVIA